MSPETESLLTTLDVCLRMDLISGDDFTEEEQARNKWYESQSKLNTEIWGEGGAAQSWVGDHNGTLGWEQQWLSGDDQVWGPVRTWP